LHPLNQGVSGQEHPEMGNSEKHFPQCVRPNSHGRRRHLHQSHLWTSIEPSGQRCPHKTLSSNHPHFRGSTVTHWHDVGNNSTVWKIPKGDGLACLVENLVPRQRHRLQMGPQGLVFTYGNCPEDQIAFGSWRSRAIGDPSANRTPDTVVVLPHQAFDETEPAWGCRLTPRSLSQASLPSFCNSERRILARGICSCSKRRQIPRSARNENVGLSPISLSSRPERSGAEGPCVCNALRHCPRCPNTPLISGTQHYRRVWCDQCRMNPQAAAAWSHPSHRVPRQPAEVRFRSRLD
jgi:hypothetical protein